MRYLFPLVLAALLAGCSRDKTTTIVTPDGEVTFDSASNGFTIRNDQMVVQFDGADEVRANMSDGTSVVGGTTIPENFPLKVPAGAVVESAMRTSKETGEQTFIVGFTTSGSQAETAADFEKQLKEKELAVERLELSDEGTSVVMLSGRSDANHAEVHVSTEGGKTRVLVTWTKERKTE